MARAPAPPQGRVLIVDDEAPIVVLLTAYLQRVGWTVAWAANLEGARHLLANDFPFDVALVDLRLSPEDRAGGLEVVDLAARLSPATKVIVLTAYGSKQIEEAVRSRRVAAYLQKPVPLPGLARLMSTVAAGTVAGEASA